MEDRQFDPNNTEERPAENATEKQQQGNFLSQFLARRRGEKLDTNETDDDDEETEEKPKHWRAKFKSFFKTVVPPPEGEVAAPKDPPAAELFAWPFSQTVRTESVPQGNTTSEIPAVEAPGSPTAATSAEAGQVMAQAREEVRVEQPTAAESAQMPELTQEDAPSPVEATQEMPQPVASEVNETRDTASPELQMRESSAIYHGELAIPHERTQLTPQPAIEKETVIERGVGSALPVALVAAEYIGRKRADRKITEAFTKKTDHLEKDAVEARRAHEQLDQLLRQNREQLASLKQERSASNNKSPETKSNVAPAVPIEQLRPQVVPELPKNNPETGNHQRDMPKAKEEVEPKPQHIMEQVAQAAEQDVPVERVFERSHEVKDDTSPVVTSGVSAASVGAIMANRSAQTQVSTPTTTKHKPTTNLVDNLPFITEQTPEMYKQAMSAGFAAGLVIIVLGLLAYLMIK